ncbi:class III chitinase [Dichotomocladium elegans]|nr:class III chitinase [Dichotomocladium elegans]
MVPIRIIHCAAFALSLITLGSAFDIGCNSNVVGYWGQNSYGAANGADTANWQKPLRTYCQDDTIDMFPIAFLTTFFGTGGKPVINIANTCNTVDQPVFPGTELANCTSVLQEDIKYCQSRGKAVTLSLGGATGGVGFPSEQQASAFADTIWNDFLGGSSNTRPFGSAILDGIDLDIEGGGSAYYPTFLNALKRHFDASSRKYYVTAAPQCVYPDANLQNTINAFPVDAIFVQFYNNPCGLQTYGQAANWNFGQWDYWARNISPNPNVKVYIGAPASSTAAGSGYVPLATLQNIARQTRQQFPSFGGVMYWDASQAYANGRYDVGIKSSLSQGGSCGGSAPSLPLCSTVPAWVSTRTYTAGSKVSYQYIWEAKWSASAAPSNGVNSEWSPVQACTGAGGSAPTSTSTTMLSTTTASSTITITSTTTAMELPTTTTQPTPGGGQCGSVAAWSLNQAYSAGTRVVYNGNIYVAKWWNFNEAPDKSSAWTAQGACE